MSQINFALLQVRSAQRCAHIIVKALKSSSSTLPGKRSLSSMLSHSSHCYATGCPVQAGPAA